MPHHAKGAVEELFAHVGGRRRRRHFRGLIELMSEEDAQEGTERSEGDHSQYSTYDFARPALHA
jgi:hypothetical protein